MFGMSPSVEYLAGVNMYPPQILYFTIALSLVVGLDTTLGFNARDVWPSTDNYGFYRRSTSQDVLGA